LEIDGKIACAGSHKHDVTDLFFDFMEELKSEDR
jgi:hypothetical protein